MSTSRFKYHERSADTVSARSKQSGGNFDSYLKSSVSFLKVKEGKNKFRIMPPTWNTKGPFGDNWGIEIFVHRDVGPDNDVYLCIDEMRKLYGVDFVPKKLGDCPLCLARRDAEDEEQAKKLKAGKQILGLAINRDAVADGPGVWRMGWQLERDIQLRSIEEGSNAVIPIDHPDRGYDITFTREGAGLKTKYIGVSVARSDSPLHDKQRQQDAWMDFAQDNPLPELLQFYDAEYIEKVYRGKSTNKKADEEEDDRRPTRTARREEPADEEDDRRAPARGSRRDEPDDEPPARRRRAEPEEDEVEQPPRRARSAVPDDDLPDDAQMARNTERARGRREDPEDDAPPPRRRAAAVEEDDAPPPRRRAAARDEEVDEAPPPRRRAAAEPADEEVDRRGSRRAPPADEDPGEEEDDAPPPRRRSSTSERGQESVDRLRGGRR